jgi:hypothetical protein
LPSPQKFLGKRIGFSSFFEKFLVKELEVRVRGRKRCFATKIVRVRVRKGVSRDLM